MPTPKLVLRPQEDPDGVKGIFRHGRAMAVQWDDAAKMASDMRIVKGYLSTLPVERSFPGGDGLQADRQALWVASTGQGKPFHTEPEAIAGLDGDREGGERGLAVLADRLDVADALWRLCCEIDRGLWLAVEGLGLYQDLPRSIIDAITVRYRAIRYAPVERPVAGIGVHPDGNAISALVTDRPGLAVVAGRGHVERPEPGAGTIVMPGSILTRWSDGAILPTVHGVEIHRGDPIKFSVVGFLNFPDGVEVPRSPRFTSRDDPFVNDVRAFKKDDMDPRGYHADFYEQNGITVLDWRFRSLSELDDRD